MNHNLVAKNWQDYECIDSGNGEKIERWKDVILRRPDPQAIWPIEKEDELWHKPHAHYHRSEKGGGNWEFIKKVKEKWTIQYGPLIFKVSPTGFKHTGIFPEQGANWDYMMEKIKSANREIRVLNLFAYTGGATMACANAGAHEVVHVDASKGMVTWAKENMELSHLSDKKIRFIVDDVVKFVEREKRRGRTYHAIIMDPPSYGRGPNGELWKIEEQLYPLVKTCMEILDEKPLFFIINSYTTGFNATVLENLLHATVAKEHSEGKIQTGEIGLPITRTNTILPCGIYGRWESIQ